MRGLAVALILAATVPSLRGEEVAAARAEVRNGEVSAQRDSAGHVTISSVPPRLPLRQTTSDLHEQQALSRIEESLRAMAMRLNALQVKQHELGDQIENGLDAMKEEQAGSSPLTQPFLAEPVTLPFLAEPLTQPYLAEQNANQRLQERVTIGFAAVGLLLLLGMAASGFVLLRLSRVHRDDKHALRETLSELKEYVDQAAATLRNHVSQLGEREEPADPAHSSGEPLHSLAFPLADEVVRMRSRLDRLPIEERNITPLRKALERLESTLNECGYEIIDYMGQPYNDGMNLKATFVPNKELGPSERTITRVIKPQVNFHGISVHPAEVEVSIGQDAKLAGGANHDTDKN